MKVLVCIFFSFMINIVYSQKMVKFNIEKFHEYFVSKNQKSNKDIITLEITKKTDSLIILHYECSSKYESYEEHLTNTYVEDVIYYSTFIMNERRYLLRAKDCKEKEIFLNLYKDVKFHKITKQQGIFTGTYDPPRIEIFLTNDFKFNEKEFYKHYDLLGFSKDDEIIKKHKQEISQFFNSRY